jgi:long-subunit acyl-CoA synthetase (AMP-forming)
MSEATASACTKGFSGILDGRVKSVPGSAGILIPGMEARILREDDSDADLNEPGELWLKGGTIALGYWNNKEATRETFIDGWLKTGDRFSIDADGNFL